MSALRWVGALALDLGWGEPPETMHPVVLTGRAIAALEARAPVEPRAQLAYGVALVAIPAALAVGASALSRALRPASVRELACLWLLKTTFSLRALLDAARDVERALERGDLPDAREKLRALVSRPREALDAEHVASAAIESLAENLCDSYVAPLVYYRLGGLPAALAYRVVNTADAMVGYHGRYELLGKFAAGLDDALNFVPARLTALALVAAAPLVGMRGGAALRTLREHGRTESPNAGWPMAAASGACGVRLEKPEHYRLGQGRAPRAADIGAAGRLVLAAALLATLGALILGRLGRDG